MDRNKSQKSSNSNDSGREARGEVVTYLSPDFINPGFQRKPKFPGEMVGLDFGVKFLQEENVKGISLCQNVNFVRDMHVRLGVFNEGPREQFPVNWPISLNRNNMQKLKTDGPFVVAPKPVGIRYLLYVDSDGMMFMENNTQHVFKVDPDLAPKVIPKDTILDGIVVKKLVRGKGSKRNVDGAKLNFVIMDATRVDGDQLTQKGILDRISAVQMMMQGKPSEGKVFDLDIAKYVAASQMEDYLSQGFKDRYEYPLRSFVFHPLDGMYNCWRDGSQFFQWDETNDEKFVFRLKIAAGEGQSTGDLYAVGPRREEVKFESIDLTDELRTMNGCIIECHWVDNCWSLVRVRTDRKHPNGLRAISGKLETLKNPTTRSMLIASLLGNANGI